MDEDGIDEIVDASYLADEFLDEDGYFCPECEREFDIFSGIYQHAEDMPSCSYLLSFPHCLARMSNQIRNRVCCDTFSRMVYGYFGSIDYINVFSLLQVYHQMLVPNSFSFSI